MKKFWPLIALMLNAGCALNAPIQHIVVDQNTVLSNSTDEVMLTNILRAKNNQPMHFSLVSQFHGSASLTAGLTLGAAFPTAGTVGSIAQLVQPGAAANDTTTITSQSTSGAPTYSPSATGSFSEMPSFDSTIIDSQAFFQGFLKPIDADIIGHFLYDGWSPRLLTYLLVKRIELVSANDYDECGKIIDPEKKKSCPASGADTKPFIRKGEPIAYLNNNIFQEELDNGKHNGVNPFEDLIDHFQITGVASSTDDDTPLFEVKQVSSMAGIDKIDGKDFDMKDRLLYRKGDANPVLILSRIDHGAAGRDVQVKRSETESIRLPFFAVVDSVNDNAALPASDKTGRQDCRITGSPEPLTCAHAIAANRIFTQTDIDEGASEAPKDSLLHVEKTHNGKPAGADIQVVIKAELRSPEAVFYFVGEYLRKMEQDQADPARSGPAPFKVRQEWPTGICNAGEPQPLIVATPVRPSRTLLSAQLNGVSYYIPDSRSACNGQSMKVLTLLEQLFYLQVSSSDKLGLTPTVHVVP